jgi:hypothetical protein
LGGFSQGDLKEIPLSPPFSKGDLNAGAYLRISSKFPFDISWNPFYISTTV